MGLACSKTALADTTGRLGRAASSSRSSNSRNTTSKKSHTNHGESQQGLVRAPPPVPPRDKKPRLSRTSELRNRFSSGRRSSSNNKVTKDGGGSGGSDGGAGYNDSCGSVVVDVASVRDQGVVVLVRIRPISQSEQGQRGFLQVQDSTQLHVPASKSTPKEKTCTFDAVLPPNTTQEEVYQVAGPRLVHNLLQGFNATMIAYGQTGSGKTFTMEGTGQDPGVIPRLCRGLFEAIGNLGPGKAVSVVASYVEIYNENIVDLLTDAASSSSSSSGGGGRQNSPAAKKGSPKVSRQGSSSVLPATPPGGSSGGYAGGGGGVSPGAGGGKPTIREGKDGVYVENVMEQRVHSEAAVLALLSRGSNARTKAETQMNAASSRSHAVLTLSIKQTPLSDSSGDEAAGGTLSPAAAAENIGVIRSKISLVDLAGSERAKSTGAAGQRLKEGAQINKSLSALGNVIKALTSGGNAHVPYRDSKLTRLLQDSLGGTAYTVVCCNVSPIEASEPETLSTLRFAERLKKVKNKMVVHMDARSKEILALKKENAELRARLEELEGVMMMNGGGQGGGGGGGAPQQLEEARRTAAGNDPQNDAPQNSSGNWNDVETSPRQHAHSNSKSNSNSVSNSPRQGTTDASSSSNRSKMSSPRTAAGTTSPGTKTPPPVPPRPRSPLPA